MNKKVNGNWTQEYMFNRSANYDLENSILIPIKETEAANSYKFKKSILVDFSEYPKIIDDAIAKQSEILSHMFGLIITEESFSVHNMTRYTINFTVSELPEAWSICTLTFDGDKYLRINELNTFFMDANQSMGEYIRWCRERHINVSRFLMLPSPKSDRYSGWNFDIKTMPADAKLVKAKKERERERREFEEKINGRKAILEEGKKPLMQALPIPKELLDLSASAEFTHNARTDADVVGGPVGSSKAI